jgi:hypothetical protein
MAYIINKFDGSPLLVLEDGTLNTSTSIGLLGRNYVGYGETQNENFLFLLENFANNSPPTTPTTGQTWFNKTTTALNVYTGEAWVPVGAAAISDEEPVPTDGSLWYKTTTDQLFVYEVDQWKLIGPEAVEGFGVTKFQSTTIIDNNDVTRPIIKAIVNDIVIAICSSTTFTIKPSNAISGFFTVQAGITLSTSHTIAGSLTGNASTATRFATTRTINNVPFDGTSNVTIASNTANSLVGGAYITGSNFNGSAETTWAVDATSNNTAQKVVARDDQGNFAAGTITANLTGNVAGNVTATVGTSTFATVVANEFIGINLTGNALTATRLQTARAINGVSFNGTADITVPVSGLNVTGNRLASTVVESAITTVGILTSLRIQDAGITLGNNQDVEFTIDQSAYATLKVNNGQGLNISIADNKQAAGRADFEFMPSDVALAAGGSNDPAFVGDLNSKCNIGLPSRTFGTVYADIFEGIATQAQYADLAENYVADLQYEPGTVVAFGGEFEITIADDATRAVAGIVSTKPAYLMNSECQGAHVIALALQGRVPCKVRGKIRKGDMLISGGDGYARPSPNPQLGTVVGKALEDFDGLDGVIEVAAGRM